MIKNIQYNSIIMNEIENKDPPIRGILKLGENAKYSEQKSQDTMSAVALATQEARKREAERIAAESLASYLEAQQRVAAQGQVQKATKSLETALKEQVRIHQDNPAHPAIWQVAKVLGDIALRAAVKAIDNHQLEQGLHLLKTVQHHTEPIAGSGWSSNSEWVLLRKNLHKNLALTHQKTALWQQAFDQLKLALRLEQQLGLSQDATNTSLTCAILQQKMKNYGLSIDFAQQCLKNIEQHIGVKKGKAIEETKYKGADQQRRRQNDKHMTSYAIALHILGKNLLQLNYLKEAKHFVTKAHFVITKMLSQEKKPDLELAIQVDMKTVLEKLRAEELAVPTGSLNPQTGKRLLRKDQGPLTDDDIERSLATIKNGLATVTDDHDVVAERLKIIEKEANELPLELGDLKKPEAFSKDEQLEQEQPPVPSPKKLSAKRPAEPDQNEMTPAQTKDKVAIKKQNQLRQSDQADQRETEPEYMQRLEQYTRRQEELRLKHENFQKRQQEVKEKRARTQEIKNRQKAIAESGLNKTIVPDKETTKPVADKKPLANKLERYKSDQRTKYAPVNLARVGAQKDTPGVVHVGAKGTKKFFAQRKKQILSLNREQYDAENDEVKLTAQEYRERKELKDKDEQERFKLPPIVSIEVDANGPISSARKRQPSVSGAGSPKKDAKLYDTGLKSTTTLVEAVRDRTLKPPKAGSLVAQKQEIESVDFEEDSRQSLAKRKAQFVEEEEEEEQDVYVPDDLSDGAGGNYQISQDAKAVLAREDSNFLVKHKSFNQLKADEVAQKKKEAEEEQEEDPMSGIQKLTEGLKMLSMQDHVKTVSLGLEQVEVTEKPSQEIISIDNKPSILKSKSKKKKKSNSSSPSPKDGKKSIRFAVEYDKDGVEKMHDPLAAKKAIQDERASRISRARGRQSGQKGSQSKAGASPKSKATRIKELREERMGKSQRENEKTKRLTQLANEKHNVRSYMGLEKQKIVEKDEDGDDDLTIYTKPVVDEQRMNNLSKPKDKEKHKLIHDFKQEAIKKMALDGMNVNQKEIKLAERMKKQKPISFMDYIDRDVPHIGTDGEFARKKKKSKKYLLKEDFKVDKDEGLFEDKGKKTQAQLLEEEKQAILQGKPVKDSDEAAAHLPNYLQAARKANIAESKIDNGNQARVKAFRKAMNDVVVKEMGLQNHIKFSEPQYINLKELRELEFKSAQKIQSLARCYFTRKWYLNYIVRKKLGVPFSGLEFAQNPFLRQFNKPNTNLNRLQQVDPSKFAKVIPTANDVKLSTIQIKRLRNKQDEKLRIKGNTRLPDDTDGSRFIAKSMQKGTSPTKIIHELQQDFLAQGLDAYEQFKRLNMGLDHDAEGNPVKRVVIYGKEIVEEVKDKNAPKSVYGFPGTPAWIGDQTIGAGRMIDTSENQQYIDRKNGKKNPKKDHDGLSLAVMAHHISNNEGPDPEGGDDGPSGGGVDGKDLRKAIRIARDGNDEEAFFGVHQYQNFSREPIVFYKKVINDSKMLRWTVKVGAAFKNKMKGELKFFLPITLLGQVLGSNQLVVYKMNIELIKVSENLALHLETFKFETIWPFILYLFNYWVKNQASLMMQSQGHSQRQIYQAELRRINKTRNYIQFFNETPEILEEIEKRERIETIDADENRGTPRASLKKPIASAGFATEGRQSKKQYDNFMDFSSEIEFDDRFEVDAYMEANRGVGTLINGQHRIDRTLPQEARPNTKIQREKNRKKLFEAYKQQVEEHEMEKNKVTFDQKVDEEQNQKDPEKAKSEQQMEEALRKLIEAEKYQVNIAQFINEQYLYLPANKQGSMFQLLRALQSKPYAEVEKMSAPSKKNMAYMNEERRKRLNLPPLTEIDYNCMERAAQKLKLIIDCLMLQKRMNGSTVVPKDLIITQMFKQQEKRREWHVRNALKMNKISRSIYRQWGQHVVVEPAFNPDSVQVQQSVLQIKQHQHQFQEGTADGITDTIQKELDLEKTPVYTAVFDMEMAEFEQRYGSGKVAPPGRHLYEYDAFAIRKKRIENEYESYIEDGIIVDQQAVRLPEEQIGKSQIMIMTIKVRKIKSNIENILQILWEREDEEKKKAQLKNKIFTGDRNLDNMESDEDPEFYQNPEHDYLPKRSARLQNEKQRAQLLEQAPKIKRLQSKVCKIISDHEDVIAFDAEEYPLGTEKISKFMILDVAQEKLDKERTVYKSFAEVMICSPISRRQMWDDTINLPWEVFVEFFKIFGLEFNPILFLKRGHFRREETFLVNEYFARCFYLDSNNLNELRIDLKRIDFHQIKYEEIFLRRPEHDIIVERHYLEDEPEEIPKSNNANVMNRKLFEKYITNDLYVHRFDPSDYDKCIFPFFDFTDGTFNKLFKFAHQKEFTHWITKFKDQEEQKDIRPLDLGRPLLQIGRMSTTDPIYMVEEQTMNFIRQDKQHMFNLSLSNFNNRKDDLLYLGRLRFPTPLGFSKIEPVNGTLAPAYNVKIEYFVRGLMPTVLVKAFDCNNMEVLQHTIVNQRHIKMLIRLCNQQSDKMITNQLQALFSIRTSKLTVGRSLFLNFDRRQLKFKNLSQQFVNMMICNESLLQRFVDNSEACKEQNRNNGIRQFKGILRNLHNLQGERKQARAWLVNINQYDIHVETLLYYNPIAMIHGNRQINVQKVQQDILLPLLQRNQKTKSYDKVKVWKINMLDTSSGTSHDVVLSLHDLVHFYESDIPKYFDLDNPVKLPNLIDLLGDYVGMIVSYRTPIGRIFLWQLQQYKRRVDEKTGRMLPLNPDEMFCMKILGSYTQMLKNIEEQQTFEDNNALPLSLDAEKKEGTKPRVGPPNLCLRCKTIAEKNLPIHENNSLQILRLAALDTQIVLQRPKFFRGSFKRAQYVLITVLLQPSMECWIWQLYFPRTQRMFSVQIYSSDLFALDDDILNHENVLSAPDPSIALWAYLIDLCRLVRNPIGDVLLQIENFKEPLREILFQDIVYNQAAKDMLFMEVCLKSYSNFVTDVEEAYPAIELKQDEMRKHTFAIRAFSLTKRIWIKDYQPFNEMVNMLKRENFYVEGTEYFYYSMLKNIALLISNKIVFSEAAKTMEVKKRRLVYDIKNIIGRKRGAVNEGGDNMIKEEVPKQQDKDPGQAKNMLKQRADWENVELLNRIVYQAIISHNPVQLCTVIFNEVNDLFVYRLYRPVDSSVFERQISCNDCIKTCAPHLRSMLVNGLHNQLGERVAQHYMANVLVASVLEFHKIR